VSLSLRRATANDVPALTDIRCAAFAVGDDPGVLEEARRDVEEEWPHCFLLEEDGVPVAAAGVYPHRIQVGRCAILKADVGHVGVLPERQGQGLGTRLMQELMALLPAEGFHCTRLGGLMAFYRRFGYEPFPRRYIQIEVQPPEARLKAFRWAELLAVPPELAPHVRPYDPAADHAGRWELTQRFNAGRSGHLVESPGRPPPAGAPPDPLSLVYEEAGVVRGFLRGYLGPVHAGQPPVYHIAQLAVDYDCPAAAEALLKTFLTQAASIAPTTVWGRMPYDERLFDLMNAVGIQFEVVEMRQGFDGNMMQVLDLPGLLATIAPELTARLQVAGCCPWEGSVGIRIPRHEVVLGVSAAGVTVVAGPPVGPVIETNHATILKWVLGITGAAEYPWLTSDLTGPQRVTLSLLFPRLPTASGVWG
jgi:putative acetyltransferase